MKVLENPKTFILSFSDIHHKTPFQHFFHRFINSVFSSVSTAALHGFVEEQKINTVFVFMCQGQRFVHIRICIFVKIFLMCSFTRFCFTFVQWDYLELYKELEGFPSVQPTCSSQPTNALHFLKRIKCYCQQQSQHRFFHYYNERQKIHRANFLTFCAKRCNKKLSH